MKLYATRKCNTILHPQNSDFAAAFYAAVSGKPTSGFTLSSDSYICRNKIGYVELSVEVTAAYESGGLTTVAFAPEGYRPRSAKKLIGYVFANGDYKVAHGYVYPNGDIKVFANLTTGTYQFGLFGGYSIEI